MAWGAAQAQALYTALMDHARSLGVFEGGVNDHEPPRSPGTGVSLAVLLGPVSTLRSSGVAAVSLRVTFSLRIYSSYMQRPLDGEDANVLGALATLMAAYAGDFTLGGLVREVDLLGMEGVSLAAEPGFLNQEGKEFRVIELTVPLILNDVLAEVA